MKLTRPLAAAALAIGLLAGCASEPSASDRTEEGVKVALEEYVETGLHGNMTPEMTEAYCTEVITARARDKQPSICEGAPTTRTNSTWKGIDSVESVSITGDTATVTWWWHGRDSTDITETSDTFIFEDGRWRHDN